jgi:O-antigen/teichoic acid export membrane protein
MAMQATMGVAGVVLVRWLSIADYARFSFGLTFQTSLAFIMDLGIATSITALVAKQHHDRTVVGRYIQAGLHLRSRLLLIAYTVGGAAFAYLAHRQGWTPSQQLSMFAIVSASLLAQFWLSIYSIPLILHQRLGAYYAVQTSGYGVRLICVCALHFFSRLTAETAMLSGTAALFCAAIGFKILSAPLHTPPAEVDREARTKILGYIRPRAPLVVFQAVQSQVIIFILAFCGVARPVAEVSALGRLGQFFALLVAFNGVVLTPTFARLGLDRLLRMYLRTAAVACGIASLIGGAVFACPKPILWILGSRYAGLAGPLRFVVLGACISYVSSVLYHMHSARKWVYAWATWLEIALVLAAQVCGIMLLNVSTTSGACKLGVLTAAMVMVAHVAVGVYSLRKDFVRPVKLMVQFVS